MLSTLGVDTYTVEGAIISKLTPAVESIAAVSKGVSNTLTNAIVAGVLKERNVVSSNQGC